MSIFTTDTPEAILNACGNDHSWISLNAVISEAEAAMKTVEDDDVTEATRLVRVRGQLARIMNAAMSGRGAIEDKALA